MERRPELTIIAGPNGAGKSQTHKVVDNPPQWFKEQFEELFEQL
jgi:predicted ABC-type ATPase